MTASCLEANRRRRGDAAFCQRYGSTTILRTAELSHIDQAAPLHGAGSGAPRASHAKPLTSQAQPA
jgi:hypothetical protein